MSLMAGEADHQRTTARYLARGDEDGDLALIPDAEGVERRDEVRAQQGRDALALEEALHDERLGLLAAMHLDQAVLIFRRPGCPAPAREGYDLPASSHVTSVNR